MVPEVAGPRMQDRQTAEPPAHIAAIAGEREEGRRRAFHQQPVHEFLMGSREGPQRIRQGEGEQIVGARQQAGALRGEPPVSLVAVALGTMAVAAGVPRVHLPPAVIALMDVASQGRRATGVEIAQGPPVTGQHAIREARQVRRPVEADDRRHLQHDAL